MAANLLLLNEFLPSSALGLGWLADTLKDPVMDAFQSPKPIPEESVLRTVGQNFEALASSASTNSFRLSLTRLLKNSDSFKNSKDAELKAVEVNRYLLRQPKAVFRELVKDEQARAWLNETIETGHRSYMIVELQTAKDPALGRKQTSESSVDVDLTVPVSTIATGGVDVLGLGAQLDSEVGGGYSRTSDQKKNFSLEGEHIFAIGFKRIVWRSLGFSKNIDKARLDDKITWSVFGEKRGNNEEEVIGADLADELDGKYVPGEGEEVGEDEDEDEEDEDDEVAELLGNSIAVGDQVYMVAGEEDDD
ncbi:hypothetical protein BU24DRAFT_497305 [Aaosphaeria arxii CBS 175.79]|uniref:Uncharacterized protein n=1 Tax=Aaosphaeria arxii CBS 175.79 TaxID=1450172 RepID=A0A6A5XAF1_9PLEO|nr:uncharacterized protein BU24DRAFT_497305 [Aaosphaeria arxii CBS 175.79]KAF2009744.1 hypothetical protein BU24DRAFT_497305 [Aaosphaeria arxii CBS 175.79]